MHTGLLSRLVSYSPMPGRTAKEDFFTEAFAGVLERTPEFARALLPTLIDGQEDLSPDAHVRIDTQVSYPIPETLARCRPDMVIHVHSPDGRR